jgi:hypothetical protein
MDNLNDNENLPVPVEQPEHDGFDDHDDGSSFGPIEKFVDGDWSIGGVPADPKRRLLAVGTETWLRRWKDKRVIDEIKDKPLPDLEMLNESIPKSEWEIGLDGITPRKPYERAHRVDFLNLDTGEHTNFVAATAGAARAVAQLKKQVKWMRRMRGSGVVPQVVLDWAPFKTQFGMKKRPDFKVASWFDLGGGAPASVEAQAPKALPPVAPKPVKTPSTAEDLNDSLPF